jgi:hypothetical protein
MHTGGGGGGGDTVEVDPPSEIFTKLVKKDAIFP